MNGLSLIKLELKSEESAFGSLCSCFSSKSNKNRNKYLNDTQFLYEDVK